MPTLLRDRPLNVATPPLAVTVACRSGAPAGVVRQGDGHRAVIRRLEGPRVAVQDGDGDGERGARLDRGRGLGRDRQSGVKGDDAESTAQAVGEPDVPVRPGREPLRKGEGGHRMGDGDGARRPWSPG